MEDVPGAPPDEAADEPPGDDAEDGQRTAGHEPSPIRPRDKIDDGDDEGEGDRAAEAGFRFIVQLVPPQQHGDERRQKKGSGSECRDRPRPVLLLDGVGAAEGDEGRDHYAERQAYFGGLHQVLPRERGDGLVDAGAWRWFRLVAVSSSGALPESVGARPVPAGIHVVAGRAEGLRIILVAELRVAQDPVSLVDLLHLFGGRRGRVLVGMVFES